MSRRNRGFRDLIFGDAFLGLWLIPMFLFVGLLGAGLAAMLVTLYHSQGDQPGAEAAGEQGNDKAQDRGKQLADRENFPFSDPHEAGVYRIRAQEAGEPSRVGSGIAVYSGDDESYLVTTYELVARQGSPRPLETVSVLLPGGEEEAAVHNYSQARDLAIVVVRDHGGNLSVPDWRADARMNEGDPLFLVSVSGQSSEPIVEGTVVRASSHAVVGSFSVSSFAAGGALMDAAGQVVAVASREYQSSSAQGEGGAGVPIEMVCRRLLECAVGDETSEAPSEATGVSPETGQPESGEPGSGQEEPAE